ncbi:MAG: hypothetical protein BRD55_06180 [Bacteroidetes bacterium SW_9_63_38]|nr:MAG: hypothetical protein BRD55_06180 [Bacteroidetes bacterium SW_9_63_38]
MSGDVGGDFAVDRPGFPKRAEAWMHGGSHAVPVPLLSGAPESKMHCRDDGARFLQVRSAVVYM